MKFFRVPEVCSKYGVSRTTLWRWEREGIFPKRRKLGPRVVGWIDKELEAHDLRLKDEV